jgi:hypothetical protein
LVTTNEQARQIFQGLTDDLIAAAGLSTEKQRLDSTHIISNMSHLTRLGLFIRVIEGFLKRLEKQYPSSTKNSPKSTTRFIAGAPAILPTSSHPKPGDVWSSAPVTCSTWWSAFAVMPRSAI